jgi:hypothetical protein
MFGNFYLIMDLKIKGNEINLTEKGERTYKELN